MRRPSLVLATVALTAPLLTAIAPGTEAATEVRHYVNADQIGTSGWDRVINLDASGDLVASAGVAADALPGQTAAGGPDAYVRALTADLDDRWTAQFGGPGDDGAAGVATDGTRVAAGGWTAGGLVGPSAGGTDAWLRFFNADGSVRWTKQFGGARSDGVADVVMHDGAIYAAGNVARRGFIRKYALDGDLLWSADVATSAYNVPHVVVMDDEVFALLRRSPVDLPDSTYLAAYDVATGDWAGWTQTTRVVTDLATDGDLLYVTGSEQFTAVVHAYTRDGHREWSADEVVGPGEIDYTIVSTATWDGSSLVSVYWDQFNNEGRLVAIGPGGRVRWQRPLPDLAPDQAFFGGRALYLGGATTGSLDGASAGSGDAVVARFVTFQPDAKARRPQRAVVGNDWYSRRHQNLTVPVTGVATSRAILIAQNDGEVPQRLRLAGCGNHDGYTFKYWRGTTDVTRAVTRGDFQTSSLAPQGDAQLTVTVTPLRRTTGRTSCRFVVTSPATDERDRFILTIKRS